MRWPRKGAIAKKPSDRHNRSSKLLANLIYAKIAEAAQKHGIAVLGTLFEPAKERCSGQLDCFVGADKGRPPVRGDGLETVIGPQSQPNGGGEFCGQCFIGVWII
jgi:hypothetical protein